MYWAVAEIRRPKAFLCWFFLILKRKQQQSKNTNTITSQRSNHNINTQLLTTAFVALFHMAFCSSLSNFFSLDLATTLALIDSSRWSALLDPPCNRATWFLAVTDFKACFDNTGSCFFLWLNFSLLSERVTSNLQWIQKLRHATYRFSVKSLTA